jgi:hypothetical protein
MIQPADIMAIGAQGAGQIGHLGIGLPVGFQIGQLAADMHVDAHDLDPGQPGGSA